MKEQLIAFDTAKLAWEKGFRIVTKLNPNYYERYNINKVLGRQYGYTVIQGFLKEKDPSIYLAPTQSLLQKWLREKHQIFLNSISGYELGTRFEVTWRNGFDYDTNYTDMFKSYEDALEEALKEGLSKI